MLAGQLGKLSWIGLQGAQEVIDERHRGIAGFILPEFLLDLGFNFGQGACVCLALVLDTQDMPPKGRAYDVAQLPYREREGRLLKRLHHLSARKIAEVATLLGRCRIFRMLLCQGRKIFPMTQGG